MLENGFEIVENFATDSEVASLLEDIDKITLPINAGGIRNIEKKSDNVFSYCHSKKLIETANRYLEGNTRLVRAILFNKTETNNWLVSWHQDRTVAVSSFFEAKGWGPWSNKQGTLHVQPPLDVLNQMVSIRIHLDANTLETGCLKVIPDSHKEGLLSADAISQYLSKSKPHLCIAKKGSALIMRPHLLHASSKASIPSQRRVLHLEYSSYQLPEGVCWA